MSEEDGDLLPGGSAARVGLLAGPALFAAALLLPLPDLVSATGQAVPASHAVRVVMGLSLWMATWWMTEAFPLAATALLPILVLPLAGVLPARDVARVYFDDTIMLFLGGFCLALAMERTGLHRRFAFAVVRLAGTRPRRLILGFFLASGLVSMWVSNTATSLMLMPVAVTVVRALVGHDKAARDEGARRFAACCLLAVAYGASLGGVGTLIGTPPNVVFQRHWQELVASGGAHTEVTFGRWMLLGVPLVAVLLPMAWWLLVRVALPVPATLAGTDGAGVLDRLRPAGRATFPERVVFFTFVTTALLWVTRQRLDVGGFVIPLTGWERLFARIPSKSGEGVSFVTDGTVAIAAALFLFAVPTRRAPGDRVLPWTYAARHLPWGTLLLFGGGFCLAESWRVPGGLNEYLAASFQGLGGLPPMLVVLAVTVGMTLLSEIANNTAATVMMLPVLSALAKGLGTDPLPILLAGTLGASCGFALPVATPPNTVAYGTGEVSVRDMVRAGLVLDVAAILVMTTGVWLLAPLVFGT